MIQQWEYMVLPMTATNYAEHEKRLTNLGSEGWEIIYVIAHSANHTIYFKRPRT